MKKAEEEIDYKEIVEDVEGYIKTRKRYYLNGKELHPMFDRDEIFKASDLKEQQEKRLYYIKYWTTHEESKEWIIRNSPLKKLIDEIKEHYNCDSPEDSRLINAISIYAGMIRAFDNCKDPHVDFYKEIALYPEHFKEITDEERIEGLFKFGIYYNLFDYDKNIGAKRYSVPIIAGTIGAHTIYYATEVMSKTECRKIYNHLSKYYDFIGLNVHDDEIDEPTRFVDALLSAGNEVGSHILLMHGIRSEVLYVTDEKKYLRYIKNIMKS